MSQATDYLWRFFEPILGPIGTAALMGNIRAESAFIPRNLQNSYEKKLGFNDDTYTAAVDSGAYSREAFARDCAGYGLVQHTYWSRKQGLYDYCKAASLSIGSVEGQSGFILKELDAYGLTAKLRGMSDLRAATELILKQYEKPADQSDANVTRRTKYAQEILDVYYKPVTEKPDLRHQIEALYLIQDQIGQIIEHLKEV